LSFFQNQILQLQNSITKLKIENETLKKQINTLEATVTILRNPSFLTFVVNGVLFFCCLKGISQVQKALVERLRTLEHEKGRIEREGEQQRKQYERCLDDVAKQVVKAVLSQKVRVQNYYLIYVQTRVADVRMDASTKTHHSMFSNKT